MIEKEVEDKLAVIARDVLRLAVQVKELSVRVSSLEDLALDGHRATVREIGLPTPIKKVQ